MGVARPSKISELHFRIETAGLDMPEALRLEMPYYYGYPPGQVWLEESDGDTFLAWKQVRNGTQPAFPRSNLNGFIHLHNAPSERILAFARTHGPLMTCEHRRQPREYFAGQLSREYNKGPWRRSDELCAQCLEWFNPPLESIGYLRELNFAEAVRMQGEVGRASGWFRWLHELWREEGVEHDYERPGPPHPREPIAAWRELAREARAILSVAASVRDGEMLRSEDRAILRARLPHLLSIGGPPYPVATELQRELDDISTLLEGAPLLLLTTIGGSWVTENASLMVDLVNQDDEMVFRLIPPGLRSRLALELAAALTSSDGVVHCDNPACGEPFTVDREKRQRSPKAGQNAYCDACRADDYKAVRPLMRRQQRARKKRAAAE